MRITERTLAGAPLPWVCVQGATPVTYQGLQNILGAYGSISAIDVYHDEITQRIIVAAWDIDGYVEYLTSTHDDWDYAVSHRQAGTTRQEPFDFSQRFFASVFEISWQQEGF